MRLAIQIAIALILGATAAQADTTTDERAAIVAAFEAYDTCYQAHAAAEGLRSRAASPLVVIAAARAQCADRWATVQGATGGWPDQEFRRTQDDTAIDNVLKARRPR